MFELSVAFKYLTPRRRQLSVSIISLISILVIALVVWLIVVFFSVTRGLEKNWINKLIALTAPVRITPTDAYYNSYYYQADGLSASSNYTLKTIGEKLNALQSDPYDPTYDSEVPSQLAMADREADGSLKDLTKKAYNITTNLPGISGLKARDYEMTVGHIRLRLVRDLPDGKSNESFVSQAAYLGSFDPDNHSLQDSLLPNSPEDVANSQLQGMETKHFANLFQTGLPSDNHFGDGILLPKSFRDAGTRLGDRGHLSYYAPTTSSMQEQRLPVYVVGFYDPGIIPIGGKYILVSSDVMNVVRPPHLEGNDHAFTNGINIRFNDIDQADQVKLALQDAFKREGIDRYWHIETYREYEFTKDLIQQLRSERNLWSLIATVIIIVACSNIISMLIILVNDKKLEIGILRSMGASSMSIAAIFGACGVVMGMVGSVLGTLLAILTLRHLQWLVDAIGKLQGYEMFNPMFYGNILPNTVSVEALLFVITATSLISLLAGVVPAIKASMIRPSTILRAQ